MYLRRGLYNTFKRRKKNGKTKCKIKLPFQKRFVISDSIAALSCFLKERIWSGNCMSVCGHNCTKLTCVNGCLSEQWKIKTDQVQESLYNELRKFYKLSEFVAIFWYSFPLLKYLARWMEAIAFQVTSRKFLCCCLEKTHESFLIAKSKPRAWLPGANSKLQQLSANKAWENNLFARFSLRFIPFISGRKSRNMWAEGVSHPYWHWWFSSILWATHWSCTEGKATQALLSNFPELFLWHLSPALKSME